MNPNPSRLPLLTLALLTAPFSHPAFAKTDGKIVLGFAQIGAESAWRIANTKSIKEAASQSGIFLKFSDAQQKQENQIKAIKSFILQKVDVIALAPVVVSGWHEVLTQAKKAGIPVILLDREIDASDKNLYAVFIGADFREEGRRAGACLLDHLEKLGMTGPVNIVELRGTEGSAPAIERKLGFAEFTTAHPNLKIIRSENGDFKESLGKEVMETVLKEEKAKGRKIHAIFAHNDNMALGAIASIEAAGLHPGKDVVTVSIDAIRDAFVAMKEGKLSCSVECSPLLGPQLMSAAMELAAGKPLPRRIMSKEGVFPAESAAQELPNRKY